MPSPNDELVSGVGQGQAAPEPIVKYDQKNGRYSDNVSPGPHLPNESPAGTDPSPFRLGPTK
jgi:hypothetical protein